MNRVGFYVGDPIKYTLLNYKGRVSTIVNPFEPEKSRVNVYVTASENPDISVGSTQQITPEEYDYLEYLPYDTCTLYLQDRTDTDEYFTFLQENAKQNRRKHLIDQSLINGDKQLFMKLVKEGE